MPLKVIQDPENEDLFATVFVDPSIILECDLKVYSNCLTEEEANTECQTYNDTYNAGFAAGQATPKVKAKAKVVTLIELAEKAEFPDMWLNPPAVTLAMIEKLASLIVWECANSFYPEKLYAMGKDLDLAEESHYYQCMKIVFDKATEMGIPPLVNIE